MGGNGLSRPGWEFRASNLKRRASTQRVAGRRVVAAASTHPKTTLSYNLLGFRVFNEPWSGRAPSNKNLSNTWTKFQRLINHHLQVHYIPLACANAIMFTYKLEPFHEVQAPSCNPANGLDLAKHCLQGPYMNRNLSRRFRLQPATLQRVEALPKNFVRFWQLQFGCRIVIFAPNLDRGPWKASWQLQFGCKIAILTKFGCEVANLASNLDLGLWRPFGNYILA